jgi:hypothetical protein
VWRRNAAQTSGRYRIVADFLSRESMPHYSLPVAIVATAVV